jgi:hypothetical protein
MVEKEDAATVRGVVEFEVAGAVRRAMGLMALLMTADRERRFREAVLHRLRLKADILQLAFCRTGRLQCSLEEKGQSYYALLKGSLAIESIYSRYWSSARLADFGRMGTYAVVNRGREARMTYVAAHPKAGQQGSTRMLIFHHGADQIRMQSLLFYLNPFIVPCSVLDMFLYVVSQTFCYPAPSIPRQVRVASARCLQCPESCSVTISHSLKVKAFRQCKCDKVV